MITRGFMEKIRTYFDELGIDARSGISYDDFEKQCIKTLNRCDELQDCQIVVSLYRYCTKKWKKIQKIFSKHIDNWKEYPFEDAAKVKTVNEEDAQGTYYITNALTKNFKKIYVSSISLGDKLCAVNYSHGRFMLEEETEYYLKYSRLDPATMKLFDTKNKLLCNIVFSNTNDVFLEKNNTKYDLIIQKEDDGSTFIGIFDKSYIDSLNDNDYIEFKNMIADMEWDLLNEKSDLGISRVTLYKEIDDITPLFYFAASTFLLYKSVTNSKSTTTGAVLTGMNRYRHF